MQEPGYQPQVEAISPTPEDRPAERDDVKSTKDDLLQKISKVDREIAKAESQIAKLKKKQVNIWKLLIFCLVWANWLLLGKKWSQKTSKGPINFFKIDKMNTGIGTRKGNLF